MDAVAAELGGEVGPVVEDEGDAAGLRDRAQDRGGTADRVVVDVLQPQLQAGDVAAGERLFETGGKLFRVEGRRREQIEPGRRRRVAVTSDQSCPW
jgi:hypothetical protein